MIPVIFISGQRGMGKTTYLRRKILIRLPRFYLYDHMGEFTKERGAGHTWSFSESIAMAQGNPSGLCRVIYSSLEPTPEEFAVVCRVPFATGDLALVCDEIDTFAGAVHPWPPEEFKRLIHFGRHFGTGFIGCSRRPADVSRAFTSQASEYVCFRQTEPADVRYLRSVLGPSADAIKDLEPLCYLRFSGGKAYRGRLSLDGRGRGE